MGDVVQCELCERAVAVHQSFVVRIDVFADPSLPPISSEELQNVDFDQTFGDLLQQMKDTSADDLQNGVHRRFEYRLCAGCHRQFLANPLGKPRVVCAGKN